MRTPTLYHAGAAHEIQQNMALMQNGMYTPARPLPAPGLNLRWRLRLAWRVLIGRYDAMQWGGGQ